MWRQKGKSTGDICGAQTGVRESLVLPLSQALSVSTLHRVEESEDRSKILQGPETCPAQGAGRAGTGTLRELSRSGGASVPVKPCQHLPFPQGSAETRPVVLGAAAKHLPAAR